MGEREREREGGRERERERERKSKDEASRGGVGRGDRRRRRLVSRRRGNMEERKRVGREAVVVLRSFTFVSTSPQTSDR
jgi:hypothetical protein